MDNVRNDGLLINELTRMGTDDDKSEHIIVGNAPRLAKGNLEELYRNPLLKRLCDEIPKMAIEKGWELIFGKDVKAEQANRIKDWLDNDKADLKVAKAMCSAQCHANVYGGAAIVMIVEDGLKQTDPIDYRRIKKLKRLRVLDRYKIRPVLENVLTLEDVEYYDIIPSRQVSNAVLEEIRQTNYRVHASRILPFYGHEYTDDMMMYNAGWGGSLIEAVWEYFKNYHGSIQNASSMLNDFSLFICQVQGLMDLVRSNEIESVQNIFRSFRMMASSWNGVAVDKEKMDLKYLERNFSGVDSVIDKMKGAFVGASDVSHDIMFRESPDGWGSKGDLEQQNNARQVAQFQKDKWNDRLKIIYKILLSSKECPTKGLEPKGWGIEYPSILQQSLADKVSARSQQSSIDSTYLSMGVLLPEEVRQSRFGGSDFSFETTLDEKAWKKQQQQTEQEANPYGASPYGGDMANATVTGGGYPSPEDQPIATETEQPEVEPDPNDVGNESVYDDAGEEPIFTKDSLRVDSISTDTMASVVTGVMNKAKKPITQWTTIASNTLGQKESYQEMLDHLPELFDQLDRDGFGDVIAEANATGYMHGVKESFDEIKGID